MSMIVRVKVVLNRTIVGITSVDVIKLWLLVIILNLLMTPGVKPFTLTYLVDVFIQCRQILLTTSGQTYQC